MIVFYRVIILLLCVVLILTTLESCSILFQPVEPTRKIKKEGPAIYISSNPKLLINKKAIIFPTNLGPNSEELGLNISENIKQCITNWKLFSQVNIYPERCDNVFTAIHQAKKLGYNYVIWLECPILLPPGVNSDEPGEIKMTFRIISTQKTITYWYIEEKIFWFNDYNAWVINDTSQALPLAIKTMLNIMCNDWHKVIIPNIQNKNKKAGLISRFLLKFSPTLSPISYVMTTHKFF